MRYFPAAIGNSQATLEKVSVSMGCIGSVANSLGYSVEETAESLSVLYNAGYDGSMAGRDKFKKGEMQIADQAAVVKEIYESYLSGLSMVQIAKNLTIKGLPTPTGKAVWGDGVIKSILTNEKYMGDCLLQKTINEHGQWRLNKGI